jgi:serine/threonine protein kinase
VDNEIKIMQLACHENVLKLFNVVENPMRVHLFLEFMDHGDLLNCIQNSQLKRMSESEAKFAMAQVTRGLQPLHKLKISHLDLKLDNILVQTKSGEKIYKIGDFGFSLIAEEVTSECGTDKYYPPEIFVDVVKKHSGPKRDVWSLGICIYAVLCGSFPFDQAYGPSLEKQVGFANYLINRVSIKIK